MKTLALVALVACSHPSPAPAPAPVAPAPAAPVTQAGDDCTRVLDKSFPVIVEMVQKAGKQIGDAEKAQMIDQCRESLAKGHRDPAMDCILAAADQAGVRDCFVKGLKEYRSETAAGEGKARMRVMKRTLEEKFAETAAFPTGKIALTPATPCCKQPDQVCAASAADWKAPAWQALDFAVEDHSRFQYSYVSDGKTVTATAVGDMLCDGHAITVTLTGKIAGGKPVIEINEPK
jgi:hypothetical protein